MIIVCCDDIIIRQLAAVANSKFRGRKQFPTHPRQLYRQSTAVRKTRSAFFVSEQIKAFLLSLRTLDYVVCCIYHVLVVVSRWNPYRQPFFQNKKKKNYLVFRPVVDNLFVLSLTTFCINFLHMHKLRSKFN